MKRSPPIHGGTKAIRAGIMASIMVVFVGYLLMWVIMPTSVYRQTWSPKLLAKTNSTYFGRQGLTILLYTFPILFISALGCVYLHLGKKVSDNYNMESNLRKHEFSSWKRPVIIKGLGIVSWTELAFLIMFIALLVWTFSSFLHLFFSRITEFPMAREDKVWEAKMDIVALTLGIVGNVCLAFLFFPVTRGSSVLPLFGLTSEGSIKYHIWLGHMAMTLFTAHGLLYFMYWALTHRLSEILKWNKTRVSNVAGELSLLFGLVLWATTFPRIRRKMFELFFYTHYLYILFMIFFILHLGISYSFLMLPGFYLFLVDRYLRFLQSRHGVRLLSARILPCQTVELNFSKSKGLSYTPTSMVFVNVPSISKLQWHPFTISSNSNLEPERLSVIIKDEGSWSKKLYQMLSAPSSHVNRLNVSIEGPYGPCSTNFLRHDTLVMVSGGSGIAPFISIIRELAFMSPALERNTPKVLLISSFKNSSGLTMLDLLLPISGNPSEFSKLELQIEAYVTREKEPTTEKPKLLRTIRFDPNDLDAPLYPILGRNSWLWLGAIISSSFIIFLIFMGLLTRYYIYPIDHNTNRIYSNTARAVLNMLLICISIAMTASAAFLWNKKQLAVEAKQIQNNEGSISQDSGFYDADKEPESLTHQSLVQSTKVHYGRRPDLKRILLECKGSSVGVLVCGPKKMRHDVATICSSASADNLHFESISFSW